MIRRVPTFVLVSFVVVCSLSGKPVVAQQDSEESNRKFLDEFRLPNGKVPNGYPCFGSYRQNECDSGYCAQLGPTLNSIPMKWCFAASTNCPAPGLHGIMYHGEYNFDGRHWFCRRGVGLLSDGAPREPGPRGNKIESVIGKKLEAAALKYLDKGEQALDRKTTPSPK